MSESELEVRAVLGDELAIELICIRELAKVLKCHPWALVKMMANQCKGFSPGQSPDTKAKITFRYIEVDEDDPRLISFTVTNAQCSLANRILDHYLKFGS